MGKVVFILGAGASHDCGAPLMFDFLDTASRLLSMDDVNGKNKHFEIVFKAISSLQAVHSKSQLDLNNIESIFTALEIANILKKLPGFEPDEIPTVIASLKEVIVETLERTIDFPTMGSSILPTRSYKHFTKLLVHLQNEAYPSIKPSIITFNYDIALDVAMHRSGLGPLYGFGPSVNASSPTNLLKLHGSLNWAVNTETEEVQPLTLQDYFKIYSYNNRLNEGRGKCKIPIGSQLQEYFSKNTSIKVKPEPVIVPPTWNKADYHHLLSTIWSAAAKELEEAEYIYIIGYSLPETDAFFRLLYGLGTVGTTPLKKIVVCNPDSSGEVESRFKNMLGPGALARFEYRNEDFYSCIGSIQNSFPNKK